MRWTFVGFCVECVGIFYLFGEYVLHYRRHGEKRVTNHVGQVLQDNGRICLQYSYYWAIPGARLAGCGRQGWSKREGA